MNSQEKKKVLVDYLKLKVNEEDWSGVLNVALELKGLSLSINVKPLGGEIRDDGPKDKDVPLQAVPPVQLEIPHHANEVVGLLRLSDEDLVDKMFPDYSQIDEVANAN